MQTTMHLYEKKKQKQKTVNNKPDWELVLELKILKEKKKWKIWSPYMIFDKKLELKDKALDMQFS